ncbi:flagellar basal-body MS-ring/collar protein FliF [Andreprevotia sp. IGB-42]|uniref:flagellar basal-body MS-ring/collar protein FliF n=1 Tax=Andreprevotia sp. IGB-42 TaxID=2497473 RepID=UPI001F003BA1|nr:flagellar basal-body MS-ring/collar protein FliF [Andreprevotia sp. IGB-42]
MQLWNKLDRVARIGLLACVLSIVLLTGALAWWALHQEEGVLFSGLSAQDASTMVAALDQMKQPYRLEQGGSTILVPAENVHKVRLQLLGKDIPLHGTVGFELFNNSDFSMTEFAQKVNYQRAMQGEITRTILAVEDIQTARVHLALPEQGLFKRQDAKAKASVSLTLKPGRQLAPEQIKGIQRLVAASVAEIDPSAVTIVDQHGVALTRSGKESGPEANPGESLEVKRTMESYLKQKLDAVLAKSFGEGKAIASVDVQLNDKASKLVVEDVLPVDKERGTGVTVRERQNTRPSAGQADTEEVTQSEYDYQVGRRVEQVERTPGGIERISVAVVLERPLSEAELGQFRAIVANTVGLVEERGDRVALYAMDQLVAEPKMQPLDMSAQEPAASAPQGNKPAVADDWQKTNIAVLLVVIAVLLAGLFVWARRGADNGVATLSDAERERLLEKVRAWVALEDDTRSEKGGL